jgi:hypothetical protein
MTGIRDPFDDLIRGALSDLAEEAISVNLTRRAVQTAGRRRLIALTVTATGAIAAVLIGAPLAVAAIDGSHQPATPGQHGPAPTAPGGVSVVVPSASPTINGPTTSTSGAPVSPGASAPTPELSQSPTPG